MSRFISILGLSVIFLGTFANANVREMRSMISNGQGISSPSFSDGLSGENPAGLAYNQSFKLQANMASFDGLTGEARPSAKMLLGNGFLGAGIEYSRFTTAPLPKGVAEINWGIAGTFQLVSTTIGVSGHHRTAGTGTYDIGVLIEPIQKLRVGIMVPDFSNGLNRFAGGLTYAIDPAVDVVVDAAYQIATGYGTIKPGLTFHSQKIQATAAYGIRILGMGNSILLPELTAGLGVELMRSLLVMYEYRGIPEHRLGLTLRFN